MIFDNIPAYSPLFPDAYINPAEKDKNWHLQFVQAAFAQNAQNQYMDGRYQQWALNRLFAQGRQPVNRYTQILCGEKGNPNQTNGQQQQGDHHHNTGTNFMNINWRIVSVMPKIRDSVINYVNKIKFRADFNAMNPAAVEEKEYRKSIWWANKQLKAEFEELQRLGGFKFDDGAEDTDWMPDEYEEFEALANAKNKILEEIRAEEGCAQVFEENEWKITERRMDESSFDLAFAAVECRNNKFTGKIEVNYIDPETLILPTFKGKVGEDIWVIGVLEWISMYQLYQEAGSQYTPEEYKLIAETFRNRYGNSWTGTWDWYGTYANRFAAWKAFQVPRVRFYWYDTNVKKFTVTKVGDREPTYRWRAWDKPAKSGTEQTSSGETVSSFSDELQSQIVRECSWIVGTNYIHNWGKLRDVSRDQMDKRQSMLPIKVYKIADQSRVERAIPYIDNMCLTWFRLQDRIARGIPPGISINLDAFEKLIIDQKEWTTQDLMELAVQRGIIMYRTTDTMMPENGGQMLPPITPHEGSGTAIFAEYFNAMDYSIKKIQDVTGINELFDTTTPDPKTLNGVAKMSYNSVINSISELIFCRQYLFEKTALDIANKLQLKAREGDVKMYINQLGTIVTLPPTLSVSQLGIRVEAVPTDNDRENMKLMLRSALETTQTPLDFDDLYYINNLIDNCPSLKLAERLINVRLNKRRKQQAEQAQAQQAMQLQAVAQTEQAKQQAAKDILAFEYQLKTEFEAALTQQILIRQGAQSQERIKQTAVRSDLKKGEKTHDAQLNMLTTNT